MNVSSANVSKERVVEALQSSGVDVEAWNDDIIQQLVTEISKGESFLKLEKNDGGSVRAVRILSVAKPVCYHEKRGLMLIELFQTFHGQGKVKMRCNAVSEKFNPLDERPQVACARALSEELEEHGIDASMFPSEPKIYVDSRASGKFAGLNSEYHLYYCKMSDEAYDKLEKRIPLDSVTPVHEENGPNPKTMWWTWVPNKPIDELEKFIKERVLVAAEHIPMAASVLENLTVPRENGQLPLEIVPVEFKNVC